MPDNRCSSELRAHCSSSARRIPNPGDAPSRLLREVQWSNGGGVHWPPLPPPTSLWTAEAASQLLTTGTRDSEISKFHLVEYCSTSKVLLSNQKQAQVQTSLSLHYKTCILRLIVSGIYPQFFCLFFIVMYFLP